MQNCKFVTNQLGEYLDGSLNISEASVLEQHLRVCSSCREKYAGVKQTIGRLRTLPKLKTSEHFNIILKARLRKEASTVGNPKLFITPRLWRLPAYSMAALLFLAVGIIIGRNWNSVISTTAMIPSSQMQAEELKSESQPGTVKVPEVESPAPVRVNYYHAVGGQPRSPQSQIYYQFREGQKSRQARSLDNRDSLEKVKSTQQPINQRFNATLVSF